MILVPRPAWDIAKLGIDQDDSSLGAGQHRGVLRARQNAELAGLGAVEWSNTAHRDPSVADQLAGDESRNSLSGDGASTITAD